MVILALFFTEPMWCCAEPDVVLDGLLSRLNQEKRAEVESHQASSAAFSALHSRAILGKAAIHQDRVSTTSIVAIDSLSR